MARIKKQLINTTVYNLLTWISKLAIFPIVVKSFEVSEYGTYGLLNALIAYGSIVFSAELYAFLRKELPGKEKRYQLSMYKSVHLPFLLVIALLVLSIIGLNLEGHIAYLIGDNSLTDEVFYALIIIIAEIGIKDIVRYFVSVKKIQIGNFLSFFNQQSWGLTLIALYFYGEPITITLWLKIKVITVFVSFVIALNLIGVNKLLKAEFNIKYLFKALGFSSVILLGVFMTQTGTFLSRFFVKEFISLQAVGLFFFSLKLPQLANGFSTSIINKVSRVHLIEAINKNELEKMRVLGGKLLIFNLVLYSLLIVPIILNLNGLILLFGKPEYLVTKPLILILFAANYFLIFSLVYYTYLFAKGRKDLLLYISIGKLVANTVVLIMGIHFFGLIGVSIAFFIGNGIYFLISWAPYRNEKMILFPKNSNKFLIIAAVVGLLFVAQLLISQFFNTTSIEYIVISSVICLATPVGLFIVLNIVKLDIKQRKISINWK
jgi:polysaccharide transporter, PST family